MWLGKNAAHLTMLGLWERNSDTAGPELLGKLLEEWLQSLSSAGYFFPVQLAF